MTPWVGGGYNEDVDLTDFGQFQDMLQENAP